MKVIEGNIYLDEHEQAVGEAFAAANPRFEVNERNINLLVQAYTVVNRNRPIEWTEEVLTELFLDLLSQGCITAKPLEAPTKVATPTAAPSPAPRKVLRAIDAIERGEYTPIEHPEHPVRRAKQDSAAHQQRIDTNRKLAMRLVDPLPAASYEATLKANPTLAEALSDEGYAGTFNPDAITIVHVQSEAKHGGGNFLSANAIAQSQANARAEANRSKKEFERGRAIGSASNAGGGMTWNNERKAL